MTRGSLTVVMLAGLVAPCPAQAQKPFEATVTIPLKPDPKGCVIDKSWEPKKKLLVSVGNGDSLKWVFKNDCATDMRLRVANFLPDLESRETYPDQVFEDPRDPRDPKCDRTTVVKTGQSAEIKCRLRLAFKGPAAKYTYPGDVRSYKYDILGNENSKPMDRMMLDPEIEVRP